MGQAGFGCCSSDGALHTGSCRLHQKLKEDEEGTREFWRYEVGLKMIHCDIKQSVSLSNSRLSAGPTFLVLSGDSGVQYYVLCICLVTRAS